MQYVGSKNKISNELASVIQPFITDNIYGYIEPFVGGANMIDKIKCENKIGCDINEELIALWHYVQNNPNGLPETITEEEYYKVRNNKDQYPKWYVALVGFCGSFGSKYFGGYARAFKADKITPRDPSNEAIRNLIKQIPNIMDVQFMHMGYEDIPVHKLHNYVVYCDPPYRESSGRKYKNKHFDHDMFWEWVRNISRNNYVFVSEFIAPDDFKCIWSKSMSTHLRMGAHEIKIEKLFIHESMMNRILGRG